jgi:hypothetical protein
MTHRACARLAPNCRPRARELHPPIRSVSGVEAASGAEPDGSQANAIRHTGTDTCLRQRFLANNTRFRLATQGWPQGATRWGGFHRPSRCDVSHQRLNYSGRLFSTCLPTGYMGRVQGSSAVTPSNQRTPVGRQDSSVQQYVQLNPLLKCFDPRTKKVTDRQ